MKQQTFALLDYAQKKKQTRRERFLSEMERCIPWKGLLAVIEPHYPRGGRRGGQPIGLAVMLRIYLMQQWFGLSDPLMEDSLYEVASMRHFAGLALNDDRIPDERTILQFRHLLARHQWSMYKGLESSKKRAVACSYETECCKKHDSAYG